MPILPGNQNYSPTLQSVVNNLKANPDLYNILGGQVGYSTEPALSLGNEVMCRILAENMPWKWNRSIVPPFLTASLQQDYCTQLTDVGWLEDGWRIDINNSTSNNNGAPKPIFSLETVRDYAGTSTQSVPFNISFIPNSQVILGLWQANTAYGCGYGTPMTPRTPIQQFMDVNGNILYIDSTKLGLNIESPGYTGTTITPPGVFPYGTSGGTQPVAPVNATPGTMIQDGTVLWTVADPNGYAMRLGPVPALNGLCWWIYTRYQKQPPQITTLQQTLAPIPYQLIYLFRAGLRAALYRENGNAQGMQMYADWEETLFKAVRAGDRQQEDNVFYPGTSLMGGNNPWLNPLSVGPAWPYGSQGGVY